MLFPIKGIGQSGNNLPWVEGLPLTDDFAVAVYVKGDYKPTQIYNTTLLIEHEGPNVTVQTELCSNGVTTTETDL